MEGNATVFTATVKNLDMYTVEDDYLTAALELEINGEIWTFGGQNIFSSDPHEANANFVTHFVHRCLAACKVKSLRELPGELIKTMVVEDRVIGVCSLTNDNWFYPALDFEVLEKGDDLE